MPVATAESVRPFQLEMVGDAPSTLTPEVMKLAQELSQIHGRVRVASENSGLHLYLASPECLTEDGAVELSKLHLSVNLDKWAQGHDRCAMCMKTDTPYNVSDLISMPRVEDRGYPDVVRNVIHDSQPREEFLEDDGRGNMVPKGPGLVVPAFRLPEDHPARIYLSKRGYKPQDLWQQFRLSYCEKERDDMYYRRLEGGFRLTPQGRLVFYIDINGINVGWQARILEEVVGSNEIGEQDVVDVAYKYFFHPYQKEWVRCMARDEELGKFCPLPGFEEPAKYFIGAGTKRNSALMGYDEAVRWNSRFRRAGEPRVAVVTEGALDAGRVGSPGIAMLGKFMSANQAALLAARFDQVIYVAQNDEAGQGAKAKVAAALTPHPGVKLTCLDVPKGVKDMGEMARSEARELVHSVVKLWRTKENYV